MCMLSASMFASDKQSYMTTLASYVVTLVLLPFLMLISAVYGVSFIVRGLWAKLREVDPMPLNQALLLAVALVALFCLAIFGDYVDGVGGV